MRRRRAGGAPLYAVTSTAAPLTTTTMSLTETVSMRDRTREFEAAVRAVKGSNPVHDKLLPTPSGRSNFARLAAAVARDIEQTSAKLARLTKLAQRRTLFDDPTARIQELTAVIKQDIAALNGKLDDLQRLRDDAKRGSSKQAGEHSASVVTSLRGRLGATAEGFKSVLKLRTASLAAQQDRRAHFTASNRTAFTPASVALDLGAGSLGNASTQRQHSQAQPNGGLAMTQVRRPGENTYQAARADAVRQVESTIVELGEIFDQLATMVSEQGEMVERIDANVEDTAFNMRAGQNQLMLYYNSIAGNRSLILKVFAVLLSFLVFWFVVLT